MEDEREQEFWRRYPADVYLLERRRKWETAAIRQQSLRFHRGIAYALAISLGLWGLLGVVYWLVK